MTDVMARVSLWDFLYMEETVMKTNALSVANYFIDLAQRDNSQITQLGLMKRVYIAYGFCLAMLDKSIFDERFDRVEAWKYGPVIPSVYHSFKQYKDKPITEKTVIMEWDEQKGIARYVTPELEEKEVKKVIEFVWNRYRGFTDSEMVSLTHRDGTPWALCYVPNMNAVIPDSFTKLYYQKLVRNILISNGFKDKYNL